MAKAITWLILIVTILKNAPLNRVLWRKLPLKIIIDYLFFQYADIFPNYFHDFQTYDEDCQ